MFPKEIQNLPITPFLEEICGTLKNSKSHFLVLTAETAAGKSTAVPIALLKSFPKKILMLEPRRIAALSIANRISEILGEETGKTAGYRMQLESKISDSTRLEILTEAILTKKLQSDPSLEEVSVVVLDEFHERSIHADLALAFLKEAMELRDDLFVIVMSATIETKTLAEYLGTGQKPAAIMKIPGRQFPVKIEYAGNISPAKAVFEQFKILKDENKFETILVFLPGIAEIRRVQNELLKYNFPPDETEILVLHSSINFNEQKKILSPQPSNKIRIILSSAIAETSITVPGVKTVIDSGWARLNKINISLGMEHLVTERESIFSAEQRAGRAGRLAPGKCIRLWNKNDILQQNAQPEILRSDITSLVLECALWGVQDESKLNWLTAPNPAAWNEASKLLKEIGCLSKTGTITETGKAALKLGIHPRLAISALCGHPEIALEFSNYAKSSPEIQKRFSENLNRRINSLQPQQKFNATQSFPFSKATALLAGFPDRIAKQTQTKGLYQFPNARIAHLKKEIIERSAILPEWIVAPEVDSGASEGTIFSYLELSSAESEDFLKKHAETKTEIFLKNGKIFKNQITVYGKIVLSTKKLQPEPNDFAVAICAQVQQKGFDSLPQNEETKNLLLRAKFYAQQKNFQDKTEKSNLEKNVNEWLLPFLGGKNSIQEKTVFDALYWFLDGAEIDKNVPTQIELPNGKKRKILYEMQSSETDKTKLVIRPVLEIIIQQIFGCFETPKILGMPILLKLLSPARRPLQITDNLANFWNSTWPEICKEMKGRYPKHNWNYKIADDSEK